MMLKCQMMLDPLTELLFNRGKDKRDIDIVEMTNQKELRHWNCDKY